MRRKQRPTPRVPEELIAVSSASLDPDTDPAVVLFYRTTQLATLGNKQRRAPGSNCSRHGDWKRRKR